MLFNLNKDDTEPGQCGISEGSLVGESRPPPVDVWIMYEGSGDIT